MPEPPTNPATGPSTDGASTGELLTRLSDQSARLVRDELALAKVEMVDKVRHAGIGAGLFSAAGLLALFGLGALIATAIIALALAVPAWLSALIVTAVLFAAAGIAALVGKGQVGRATPAAPEQAVENLKRDVEEVKEARQRDHTP